ncbi:hypothetical protein M011DRAFT_396209 [Sporormia fimetaria CBS 119925]|uniref:Rhodopsin domain-containing protein n=1 Tax=Sporormia fimetaria CBS 119925 TaxID=1340428 RepID=A0A6A6VLB5_9PLEO|nr:hypothetical protein M011DRAFT_396209 [Sporormia fimetaria CBS 119925]
MSSHTRGTAIMAALWVETLVPLVFLLLRVYCKTRCEKRFGLDDLLLIISWALCVVYTACGKVAVDNGIGMHLGDTDPARVVDGIKFFYLAATANLIGMPLSKTSFCVTLLKITATKWHRTVIWFIIVSLNLTMLMMIVITFAQCSPVKKVWNAKLPGTCWDNHVFVYYAIFAGAYSVVLDFALGTMPYFMIHKLQMNKREKLGLIVAMSLGIFAGVACAIKTASLPKIGSWADFTWHFGDVLIWGLSETSITVMAASIPFLRMLVRRSGTKSSLRSLEGNTYQLHSKTRTRTRFISGTGEPVRIYDGNTSEDNILSEDAKSGIMQTNEVLVEYDDRGKEGNFAKCS